MKSEVIAAGIVFMSIAMISVMGCIGLYLIADYEGFKKKYRAFIPIVWSTITAELIGDTYTIMGKKPKHPKKFIVGMTAVLFISRQIGNSAVSMTAVIVVTMLVDLIIGVPMVYSMKKALYLKYGVYTKTITILSALFMPVSEFLLLKIGVSLYRQKHAKISKDIDSALMAE